MPITRRQFEIRLSDKLLAHMRSIHEFLTEHKNEAFREDEIALRFPDAQTRFFQTGEDILPIISVPALQKLVELGAVDARVIDGNLYFAYREDLRV